MPSTRLFSKASLVLEFLFSFQGDCLSPRLRAGLTFQRRNDMLAFRSRTAHTTRSLPLQPSGATPHPEHGPRFGVWCHWSTW